ncbi:MAG: SMC family ATPase [Chloroflexia bacterium]|nr:SMC family ATPase [Chloroflexia bacterium]
MIPVSLRLRNFMCYRESLPPLEFGDLHVACLSGPNGAGKSALLDAITWALWGRARSRYDSDLISSGAQEMEVEFEFLLEGNHYRVFRRRDQAALGGRGKSQLDLQVYSPLGWRSMAEESIRATEQRIVQLLRMDYDTFINSAFLLQGRADEFTVKPPAERKRILGEILGLSYYETLEKRARERERAEDRIVQSLDVLLQDMESQLARREQQEQSLESARQEVQALEEQSQEVQQALADLRSRIAGLEAAARQIEGLRQRQHALQQELSRLEERLSQERARIETTQGLLEHASEIEARYEQMLELRQHNQHLSQAAGKILALGERQRALEQTIAQARGKYQTEREILRHTLGQIEQHLQEQPALQGRLAEIRAKLALLQEKQAQCQQIQETVQERMGEARTLKAECQRLRDEMEELRDKLDMLGDSTTHCPLCQSPLDPQASEHIRLTYQTEGQEKRDLYRSRQATIRQLEEEAGRLRDQQEDLEQELQQVRILERQLATLEKDERELAQLGQEQAQKEKRCQELDDLLDEGAYATAERAALGEIQQEIASLYYDPQEHQEVQHKLAHLQQAEQEHRQLQLAQEALASQTQRLQELEESEKRRQKEAHDLKSQLEELEGQVQELAALQERCQQQENTLRTVQESLARAHLALGAAQRELERLDEIEQSWQEKKEQHQEALENRGIYQELVNALGKRGVQAMLIETAVPEIEQEANELLQRMTNGEMSVQLAMQRATQKGTVSETLDINISTPQGTRPYEMYSGGESFRINFALRIALSRLLANRAGASLQSLFIDEGFGTQDSQGRERLVEAIHTIQDEFAKILVITHIQELQELFPAHIEIEKTLEGSSWTVL